ncbi:preprotein translocase subunit Sec61beta [archaeon]|nr:preprotein translocase subunit Sec61beta [archaeon]|tara:strand:- start:18443 stop:18598 length:156 start_codon:yes stop_codon:yes gene_type:complete
MADQQVQMPSGMGGLVRYFDDYKSSIEIEPEHVVAAIIIVMVFEIILQVFF